MNLARQIQVWIESTAWPDRLEDWATVYRERDQWAALLLRKQWQAWTNWGRLQLQTGYTDPASSTIVWQRARPFPVDLYRRLAPTETINGQPTHIFTTSGTTADPGRVAYSNTDLELMKTSVRRNAARHLFPDALPRTRLLVLAPAIADRPSMIMAWGMDQLVRENSVPGADWYIGRQGPRVTELFEALLDAVRNHLPVTLIGASFGLVPILEAWHKNGQILDLPTGSRVMDAGGFKGRTHEISPQQVRQLIADVLGIPASHHVNLLGMTEMASQIYDHVVGQSRTANTKRPPFWCGTLVLDPDTLTVAAPGTTGLLAHLDLANIDHPAYILTQDLGRRQANSSSHQSGQETFEWLGRAGGSEAKGCALAVEELLG